MTTRITPNRLVFLIASVAVLTGFFSAIGVVAGLMVATSKTYQELNQPPITLSALDEAMENGEVSQLVVKGAGETPDAYRFRDPVSGDTREWSVERFDVLVVGEAEESPILSPRGSVGLTDEEWGVLRGKVRNFNETAREPITIMTDSEGP